MKETKFHSLNEKMILKLVILESQTAKTHHHMSKHDEQANLKQQLDIYEMIKVKV